MTHSQSHTLNSTSDHSGSLDDSQLSANVTKAGNTFNGASQLVQLDASGNLNTNLIFVADGTAAAPSLSFKNKTNLGFYREGLNNISVSAMGSKIASFDVGGNFFITNIQATELKCPTISGCSQYLKLRGEVANSASAISCKIGNYPQLTTAGAKICSFFNDDGTFTNEKAYIDKDGKISADGSLLTALDATNISSGTLDAARLPASATVQGNTFNGASQLVQLDGTAKLPAVDGSQLTNLPSGGGGNAAKLIAQAMVSTNAQTRTLVATIPITALTSSNGKAIVKFLLYSEGGQNSLQRIDIDVVDNSAHVFTPETSGKLPAGSECNEGEFIIHSLKEGTGLERGISIGSKLFNIVTRAMYYGSGNTFSPVFDTDWMTANWSIRLYAWTDDAKWLTPTVVKYSVEVYEPI